MLKNIRLFKVIIASFFCMLCLTAHAKPVSNLIYFGCDFTGHNDAMKKWPGYLSERYGKQVKDKVENFSVSSQHADCFLSELSDYFAFDPPPQDVINSTIYVISMGQEDLRSDEARVAVSLDETLGTFLPNAGPNTLYFLDQRTTSIIWLIENLIEYGGKNFVVLNHLNDNYRGKGRGTGGLVETKHNCLGILWNTILAAKIDDLKKEYANRLDIQITLLDYFGFTTDIGMNPSFFNSSDYNAYYGGGDGDQLSMHGHIFTSDWISTQLDKLDWKQVKH